MLSANKAHNERLYLQKDESEIIYIDTSPLPQHQIDGVRFLFRQFKKKKPGVIINNPEGFGKTFQVALFLNAVRKLLKKPVLILCKDDNEVQHWKQTFNTWTNYTEEDIVIESTNIYLKKTIFIKKAMDVAVYSRRDWCMVVVKNDFAPKDLLKVPIRAEYKIWLTAIDMKRDMAMLNSIYGWLYCDKKFDIENFITSNVNCRGTLNKFILLDAFLEDIVITRNDFNTPFRTWEVSQEQINTVQKITLKNKDATGTNIKRSKRKIKETDTSFCTNESNANTSSKSDSVISNMDTDTRENKDEFRIGEYSNVVKIMKINDKVEIGAQNEFMNDTNTNSKDKNGQKERIGFSEAITAIGNDENIVKLEDTDEYNSENILSNLGKDEMNNLFVNNEENHVSFSEAINDIVMNENIVKFNDTDEHNSENILNNYQIKNVNNKVTESDKDENIIKLKDTEENNSENVVDNLRKDGMETLDVNDMNYKITSGINLDVTDGKDENSKIYIDPTAKSTSVINKINKENNVNKDNKSSITDIKQESALEKLETKRQCEEKVRDIDYKISEMEKIAMKKFKGSILDSLF